MPFHLPRKLIRSCFCRNSRYESSTYWLNATAIATGRIQCKCPAQANPAMPEVTKTKSVPWSNNMPVGEAVPLARATMPSKKSVMIATRISSSVTSPGISFSSAIDQATGRMSSRRMPVSRLAKQFSLCPTPEYQADNGVKEDEKVVLHKPEGSHLSFVFREQDDPESDSCRAHRCRYCGSKKDHR